MSSIPCSYPQAGPLVSNQKQQRAEAAIDPISIFYRLSDGHLLRFPGMADFSMDANGSRITATPVPDLDDATLDHLFLNQVAPLAMSRQHKLVLHGGAVVVEAVFALDGFGMLLATSIALRQYLAIQSLIALVAIAYVLFNLIVDALYGMIDPRVRSHRGA